MTFTYEANVREDVGDRAQMTFALKSRVAASRSTTRYREYLATSLAKLVSLDDFPDATSLLLGEIRYVSETRDDSLLKTVEEIGSSYSLALFKGISWKPDGSMRDLDPRDFVDNIGIGIGRQVKYGMTDWDEDDATFATAQYMEDAMAKYSERNLLRLAEGAGYTSVDELRANSRLGDYVRREMMDGNFEPVVKLLVHEQLDFQLKAGKGAECPKRPSDFSFAEVRRRLREAPAGTVSTTTQDILFSVQSLAESLNANCRKGL